MERVSTPAQDNRQPPYQQVAQHFRDRISSGDLTDGDRLPSVRELVTQWEISHATAHKVYATLRGEGLVTTSTGGAGGTVVTTAGLGQTPRDRVASTHRWGRIYPTGDHARIVAAELIGAPEEVAAALGVEAGSPVIRRRRVTHRGETPVSTSLSWFAGDLAGVAPALLRTERIILGTPGYVEQQTGRRATRGRDQLRPALASAEAAAVLGIEAGAPVLLGRNWFYDQHDDVLEFGESTSVEDRWQTYEYEM